MTDLAKMIEKSPKELFTEALKENVCKVTFTKVNGELREMTCTLMPDKLPPIVVKEGDTTKAEKAPNPNTVAVFVTDIKEWRSFRIDSLKSFEILQEQS